MKKIILILIIVFGALTIFAQERTVDLNNSKVWNLNKNGVRLVYTGTADDTLKYTNQDSILYTLQIGKSNRGNKALHWHMNVKSKGLTGTDTTFVVMSDYKISTTNTTYSELVPDITSAVNLVAGINTVAQTYGIISDWTIVHTSDTVGSHAVWNVTNKQNPQLHGRYLTFLFIISGDDSVGTGIEIEEIELIFDL